MKKIKISLKSLIVVVVILLIIIIAFIVIQQYNVKKEVNECKEYILQYLYNQYNEDFDIELDTLGYKVVQYDEIFGVKRYDKNIRQYVFIVYSKKLPIQSNITLWKNRKNNQIEINEINGNLMHNNDTSYSKNLKIYNEKIAIKNDLDKIIKENYNDYEIEYNLNKSGFKQIYIKLNHSIVKEIDNNLKTIKDIMDFTKNVDLYISIDFIDYVTTYPYSPGTRVGENIEKVAEEQFEHDKKYIQCVKEVYNCLDNNSIENYSLKKNKNYCLEIYLNYNYNSNKENMDKMIDELKDISKKYRKSLYLHFKDKNYNYNL